MPQRPVQADGPLATSAQEMQSTLQTLPPWATYLVPALLRSVRGVVPCVTACVLAVGLPTAVVVAGALALPAAAFAADPVRQIELDVGNLASQLSAIDADLRAAVARERKFPLDRRYVDALVAYDRGNYAMASVLLADLTANPEFQTSRDLPDALFMLGDSHYKQRNFLGAKRALDKSLSQPGRKHFEASLQLLVDIAVRMSRLDEVEAYAKRLGEISGTDRRSELLYQFGRSFFAAGQFEKAEGYLSQVSVGDKRFYSARFYLGALAVQRGQADRAVTEFREISEAGKTRDEKRRPEQIVLDYANLALGRLFLQQKKYTDASYHYALIDRNSQVYEEALFELAATQVAASDPRKALDALDLLLLTVSDDRVAVEASVLRGRINLMEKQYDKADASYAEVVEKYSAISGELRSFASSDKNLEQFFAWLLNRSSDDYTVVRPVSERVAKFIEHEEEMGRVVTLFDDMAAERADVKEAAKIASTIDAALRESTRLDMFPDLKDAWMRAIEVNNRGIDQGRKIVDLLRTWALPRMNEEDKARVGIMYDARKRLEVAFSKVPPTKGAYEQRKTRVASDYANLAADVAILKTQMGSVKEELLAVEKMLAERLYGGESASLSKEQEAAVRKGLQDVRDELRRVYRDLEEAAQAVEIQAQSVGAGDKVSNNESVIRASLAAAQRAEQAVYAAILERSGTDLTNVRRLQLARAQLDRDVLDKTSLVLAEVTKRSGERLAGLRAILAAEQRNIAEYQTAVRKYEDDSRQLARQVGYGLIRRAQERLSGVVLEADLGLVDVAWQRKNEKTAAIRELQDERSQKVRGLGEVLQNLGTVESED